MKEYTVKVYDNRTEWYLNGKLHREDGNGVQLPAVEYASGSKLWYLNGERHREDGPAREWVDGYKAWYLNGFEVTEKEVMGVKELTVAEIEKELGYRVKVVK